MTSTTPDSAVRSRGASYDNSLAESVISLYEVELVRHCGPWRGLDDLEYATLEWVDWWNHRRLLEPIGDIPPAENEADYYRRNSPPNRPDSTNRASKNPGRFTRAQSTRACAREIGAPMRSWMATAWAKATSAPSSRRQVGVAVSLPTAPLQLLFMPRYIVDQRHPHDAGPVQE